jgi:streptomycin 6-kinase
MTAKLNHYLRLWNLHDPEPLAHSPRGDVYVVHQDGEKVVLKVFTSVGAEDESDGAVALRYFDGHGAVRLLNCDNGHICWNMQGVKNWRSWWCGVKT